MNQDRIDKIGVAAAVTYFCRLGHFNPHIAFDDKIAVWDGYIEVHKQVDSLASEDIDFTIEVQVKSTEHPTNNFPPAEKQSLKISDLKHYKEKGGTLLIKVLVGRKQTQLYFAYLGKIELNKYLEKASDDTKTTTISLVKAPNNSREVIRELKTIHLQGKHNLMSAQQLASQKDFKLSFEAGPMPKEQDPFIWIASNSVDILVEIPGFTEPFYLAEGRSYIATRTSVKHQVSINGKVFFDSIEVEAGKYGYNFYIDNFFAYTIQPTETNKKTVHVKVNPNSTDIRTYIKQLEFTIALIEAKALYIDQAEFNLAGFNVSNEVIEDMNNEIRFYSAVLELFNHLNLEPNFQLNKLQETDQQSLNILINYLLGKRRFKPTDVAINSPIHIFTVAHYKIAVGVLEENGYIRLVDIHTCRAIRRRREDGKEFEIPLNSYCLQMNFLADNLDFSNLIASYEAINWEDPTEFYNLVNIDGLELLKSYDSFQNELHIKKAIEIFEWLCSKVSEDAESFNYFFLNLIQSKLRAKQLLSTVEIDKLELLTQSDTFKLPANALLGNATVSKRLWEALPKIQKQEYREFPIFTILQNLISQNNG